MYELTQEDLDSNPLLVTLGYSVGDVLTSGGARADNTGPVNPPKPPPITP